MRKQVKPGDKSGEFKRQTSVFRNWIQNKPGAEFPPEKGRYHLYVSYACPWAHRTLIVRHLKGLEDIISYNSVHWHMAEKGWRFATPDEQVSGNTTPDPLHNEYTHLRDIYFEQNPDYEGRFTVPTLYDKKAKKIVSNESAEIIRMLYTEFDDIIEEKYRKVDLFPKDLQKDIEAMNDWVYNDVNNGVYKSGFATYATLYRPFNFDCNVLIMVQHRRGLHKSCDTALQVSRSPGRVIVQVFNTIPSFKPTCD